MALIHVENLEKSFKDTSSISLEDVFMKVVGK